ncbi:unnamed protein product, partial [Mesorhabditis belari]|uniref:Glycogen debranching enzyme n=1 Tax=Mesorhabditis belari TaxID=2138241 RepID=A0AAF3EMC9_9BILA
MEICKQEIRIITLEKGQHRDDVIHRLQKGWRVRFVRGASLLSCSDIRLTCSVSSSETVKWSHAEDPLASTAEVLCEKAGAFKYEFFIENESSSSGGGRLLVMPSLVINDQELPLDGIACITHITKLLGPLSEWESRLRIVGECGYNMLHLTPIHRLGISQSAYSIMDHHALNDSFHTDNEKFTFDDLHETVKKLEKEWNIATVQDVVWNHAAKNAPWLQEHPECAYNCLNSPHLRPAYVLDRILHYFGKEIGEGKWADRGVPPVIDSVHHIHNIEYILRTEVLPRLRFHEFFQCNVDNLEENFKELCRKEARSDFQRSNLQFGLNREWRRFGQEIDFDQALKEFNIHKDDATDENDRIEKCAGAFRGHLEHLNNEGAKKSWDILMTGLKAILGHISYERVEGHGPRKGLVREEEPLLCDYFLHTFEESSWETDEALAFDPRTAEKLMAFNGWVMGLDPMKNFALADSEVYISRLLVCWGDSVKLNYGNCPGDSPYLWEYMRKYTQQVAKIFHGIRIDNAHSTPIHVAEYLLNSARAVRPDLYVFAELFTGSEDADNLFVNRLGITSLIREAMAAPDSHEQGRLVYRYGGDCVGAMRQKSIRPAERSVAHAMLLDQSHDNPTPILTRSIWDLLPTAAMVSMASCAVGSTRGYDELVRHAIHVVSETRLYAQWDLSVNEKQGLIRGRRVLNQLHQRLALEGYTQVFVDQMNTDVVGITRHNPETHQTVVLVAHTAFKGPNGSPGLKWIPLGGSLQEVLFEMTFEKVAEDSEPESNTALIGITNFSVNVKENLLVDEASTCCLHDKFLELKNFSSGTILAYSVQLDKEAQLAMDLARKYSEGRDNDLNQELDKILSTLSYSAFHFLLFSTAAEDQTLIGQGAYDVPNHGSFVYCGLQGIIPLLKRIRENNDLGHPICQNLRDGTWLADYMVNRLRERSGEFKELAETCSKIFGLLPAIPYYLRPCYFEALVGYLYTAIRRTLNDRFLATNPLMNSHLAKSLLLSTISFVADIPGARLSPLVDSEKRQIPSLAAGLPHFTTGIWRNWGRDTFIALPGCLLVPGRFEEAKNIILSYAGSMRHGLIPNLLAEGKGARYNCRDATWFWLYAIVRYAHMAPDGEAILKESVLRIFSTDDAEFMVDSRVESLAETVTEALQRHFSGIAYRERNAGTAIDEHMKDEGFNVRVWVNRDNGFIYGGNQWNCGTWMDKMGSSDKAGNRGHPATPRDGAAVEIQGLAVAVLNQMETWAQSRKIATLGVSDGESKWSWGEWSKRITSNFRKCFYIEENCADKFVNKKGIIKDTFESSQGYTDYQLRPNACIAVAIAPELLPNELSWNALEMTKQHLLGPLGIKTLDSSDWAYNGCYNNDDDGSDRKTAKGWNYHQGPEWLWVAGYYLKAKTVIGSKMGADKWNAAKKEVETHLGRCQEHIDCSTWSSLPELTQANGEHCHGSCPAQAWSVGVILEAYVDLINLQSKM